MQPATACIKSHVVHHVLSALFVFRGPGWRVSGVKWGDRVADVSPLHPPLLVMTRSDVAMAAANGFGGAKPASGKWDFMQMRRNTSAGQHNRPCKLGARSPGFISHQEEAD